MISTHIRHRLATIVEHEVAVRFEVHPLGPGIGFIGHEFAEIYARHDLVFRFGREALDGVVGGV